MNSNILLKIYILCIGIFPFCIYVIINSDTYIADTYDIAKFTAGYYLLVNTVILYK